MPRFLVHDERFSSNPLIALAFSDTAPIVAWHGRRRAFHIQAAGARSLSPVSLRVPRGFLVSRLSGPGTATEPVSDWSLFLSVTGRSDYIFPLSGPYHIRQTRSPCERSRVIVCSRLPLSPQVPIASILAQAMSWPSLQQEKFLSDFVFAYAKTKPYSSQRNAFLKKLRFEWSTRWPLKPRREQTRVRLAEP